MAVELLMPQLDLMEPQQDSSPEKRKQDRALVLTWYRDHTGTPYECCRALGMLPTTGLPRCAELKQDGCLVKVPGIPRRATGFGGTSAVLIVTAWGRKELAG